MEIVTTYSIYANLICEKGIFLPMRFGTRFVVEGGLCLLLTGCLNSNKPAVIPHIRTQYRFENDQDFYRTNKWEKDEFRLDGAEFRIVRGNLYSKGSSKVLFTFEKGEYLEVDCLTGDGKIHVTVDRLSPD